MRVSGKAGPDEEGPEDKLSITYMHGRLELPFCMSMLSDYTAGACGIYTD